MQIIIKRDNVSIPWGFRLKGGAEYNVPLSILKVNEGSPAQNYLEFGDVVASIGNFPALNLKHEEALNIIRMFDVTLPLVIYRDHTTGFTPPVKSIPKPLTSSMIWRPPSISSLSDQPASASYTSPTIPLTPSAFSSNNYDTTNYSAYSPSNNYSPSTQFSFEPMHQSYQTSVPNLIQAQVSNKTAVPPCPPPPNPPPPPPAPPLPSSFTKNNNFLKKSANADSANFNNSSSKFTNESKTQSQQGIPDALLKVMNGSGSEKKPFTYTPGGLDLSHVRQSSRVKRYDSMISSDHHQQQQYRQTHHQPRAHTPSFNNNASFNQFTSSQTSFNQSPVSFNSSNQLSSQFSNFQSYQSVPTPPPPPPPPQSIYMPSMQMGTVRGQSPLNVNVNFGNSNSAINFDAYSNSLPRVSKPANNKPAAGFIVAPEQLKRPKQNIETKDNQNMNQSYSFRMLNKWIEESEAITLAKLQSKKDEEEGSSTLKKSAVIKAIEEEEKGPQKNSQIRSNMNPKSINIVPSKVFQYVERKYSTDTEPFEEQQIQQQFMQKVPAREREQEASAKVYKGNMIPSKTFKYLQYMTQTESVIDQNSLTQQSNSINPQPVRTETFVQNAQSFSYNSPQIVSQQTNNFSSQNDSFVSNGFNPQSLKSETAEIQTAQTVTFDLPQPISHQIKNFSSKTDFIDQSCSNASNSNNVSFVKSVSLSKFNSNNNYNNNNDNNNNNNNNINKNNNNKSQVTFTHTPSLSYLEQNNLQNAKTQSLVNANIDINTVDISNEETPEVASFQINASENTSNTLEANCEIIQENAPFTLNAPEFKATCEKIENDASMTLNAPKVEAEQEIENRVSLTLIASEDKETSELIQNNASLTLNGSKVEEAKQVAENSMSLNFDTFEAVEAKEAIIDQLSLIINPSEAIEVKETTDNINNMLETPTLTNLNVDSPANLLSQENSEAVIEELKEATPVKLEVTSSESHLKESDVDVEPVENSFLISSNIEVTNEIIKNFNVPELQQSSEQTVLNTNEANANTLNSENKIETESIQQEKPVEIINSEAISLEGEQPLIENEKETYVVLSENIEISEF